MTSAYVFAAVNALDCWEVSFGQYLDFPSIFRCIAAAKFRPVCSLGWSSSHHIYESRSSRVQSPLCSPVSIGQCLKHAFSTRARTYRTVSSHPDRGIDGNGP